MYKIIIFFKFQDFQAILIKFPLQLCNICNLQYFNHTTNERNMVEKTVFKETDNNYTKNIAQEC